MKKNLLLRCLVGAPVGVVVSSVITIIFSLCLGQGEYFPAPHELIDWCGGNATAAVAVQLICSLVVGAVCGGSSVIWGNRKMEFIKANFNTFFGYRRAVFRDWLRYELVAASYLRRFVLRRRVYSCISYNVAFDIFFDKG